MGGKSKITGMLSGDKPAAKNQPNKRSGKTTPFAVQLHDYDQHVIRAVCEREGITQKELFQYFVDQFAKGREEKIELMVKDYKNKSEREDSFLYKNTNQEGKNS